MKKNLALVFVFAMYSITIFSQDVNKIELEKIVQQCKEGHSDALILYKDGQLVYESYFDKEPGKIDIKSITKSITNLAIGYLVSQNKLDIDQKVFEFYPEWKQENKQDISIRHLLTHTSGLLDSDFSLVETSPNAVRLALASDLSHPVGQYYVYNNKAVNLLVGIVEKVDGRKIDALLKEELFLPLEITDLEWPNDKAGNPYAMAFLKMYPKDLLKIGELVLQKGLWNGKQLIDSDWFDESFKPGADFMPEYGLLWELINQNFRFVVDETQLVKMRKANVDGDFIEKANSMKGVYLGYGDYYRKVRATFGENFNQILQRELVPFGLKLGRKESDGIEGYAGIGYLGQYLVIYPDEKLIAVRGINFYEGYNWDTDEIPEFPNLVKTLID